MGLPYDPEEAIAVLSANDPTMRALIKRVGPFKLEVRDVVTPFESLLEAIANQQLSAKAGATIYGRVLALFPDSQHPDPQGILDLPDEDLRAAGMSWAKVASVKDLAVKTLDGTVPTIAVLKEMDEEEIIRRLTRVRGIGPWSVEMLLIFGLGRPDILPVTDLGVRRAFMLAYQWDRLPKPSELLAYGARWRPFCSVASWYLWHVVD